MCGRFRLSQAERFAAINGLEFADGMPADEFSEVPLGWKPVPRYNIAPTQTVAVVFGDSPSTVASARWGLIPYWAKDTKIGSSLINARCETVATKPAFRDAFKRRHCLIPADGFYEWKKDGATNQAIIEFTGSGLPEKNIPAALTKLTFRGENAGQSSQDIPLGEVPAVLLAECWNDYRQIAADGSGFDPDWEKKAVL